MIIQSCSWQDTQIDLTPSIYVRLILEDAQEIHGDRMYRDDPAILCYIGWIDGQKTVLIGEQKGRGTKHKLRRNFGMPHPEGYRKALRAIKLSRKV